MQFSSRTPHDIVATPEDDALIEAGDFCYEEVYGLVPERFHNPVNPILADFRIANSGRILRAYRTTAELAAPWAEGLARDGHHSTFSRGLTEDLGHIEHARRVLTRLANLTKEDA